MPLGTFTLTISAKEIGTADATTGTVHIRAQAPILDRDGNVQWTDLEEPLPLAGGLLSLTLPTDVPAGSTAVSETVGFVLRIVGPGVWVDTAFAARAAGSTVAHADLVETIIVPVNESAAYRDAAAASASAASTSATAAATSASSASASASSASTSATDSSAARDAAVAARAAAEAAQTAAAASQTASAASQTAAAASASAASGDAAAAATARTAAETARTAAQTAQTAAESARDAAQTARTAAESARDAAAASQTAAAGSASAASTSATNAASSASSASTSATNAAASASSASTSASQAAASAASANWLTTYDAKGDLVVGTGPDTAARLPVGANGRLLLPDSAQPTGLKWSAVPYLEGTGSPEGAVTAPVGAKYVDTAATNGAVEWIKASGAGNTGWKVVYGDTGWRSLTPAAGWVVATVAGKFRLRRVGGEIMFQARLNPSGANVGVARSSTFVVIDAIPAGFRPEDYNEWGFWAYSTSPNGFLDNQATLSQLSARGSTLVSGNTTSTDIFAGTAGWSTAEAWPTTLPGTAG